MPDRSPYELIDRVTVRSAGDIRSAAEALHVVAMSLARLRPAPCSNIASK